MNTGKLQKQLFTRTEIYAAGVGEIYRRYMMKAIALVKGVKLIEGVPFSFSAYDLGDEATKLFREMYSTIYQFIKTNMEKEFNIAHVQNDDLIKSIFGAKAIEGNHYAKYFKRNSEALDQLFARKTSQGGLNLSQRVWKYTSSYKEELEAALELAIGEGTSANKMGSQIQKYLNDPDKFYRRFRVKVGENPDGTPKYGRQWKRRVFDKETKEYRWVNDNPKKYNPGQGVYRSSARNAQRLARTQTNIAYREADLDRWSQLDFIVGYEIRRSNNPYPCDVCEGLKGKYPKNFKWSGWHPNCRCNMIPIMASKDEIEDQIERILTGEDKEITNSKNAVNDFSSDFKKWIRNNQERMNKSTSLPYFIRDNKEAIKNILNP